MPPQPQFSAHDTSGSPGFLGGALALLWVALMIYGPIATWGGGALLKQPPAFLAMLAAVAIFPAFGLWMLVGAWRTAWLTGLRQAETAARLQAALDALRDDVTAMRATADSAPSATLAAAHDVPRSPRLGITSVSARFSIAACPGGASTTKPKRTPRPDTTTAPRPAAEVPQAPIALGPPPARRRVRAPRLDQTQNAAVATPTPANDVTPPTSPRRRTRRAVVSG